MLYTCWYIAALRVRHEGPTAKHTRTHRARVPRISRDLCLAEVMLLAALIIVPSAALVTGAQHAALRVHKCSVMARAAPRLSNAGTSELKERLLASCDKFKALQLEQWRKEAEAEASTTTTDERLKSPLKAEGFGNVEVTTDEVLSKLRADVIAGIEELAACSPTTEPLEGWRTEQGCALEGTWNLRFTTGADATFRPSSGQAEAPKTYQIIDSRKGVFQNCVDFADGSGKLAGFRVVVAGKQLSGSQVQLKFRRVKLLRRSRFRFFRTLIVPLPPSWFLRGLARWASRGKAQLSDRGAGFEMLYLDDELRMHKTFDVCAASNAFQ